nr:MAG TPA: hypothetical protein [Caudoviricetes sp.]
MRIYFKCLPKLIISQVIILTINAHHIFSNF